MNENNDKNKLIIDKLLNAYSIDAIISFFHVIDEKIIAIIKFSSEDFIHFNSIFRKYHEEIKLSANHSLRLFNSFNSPLNLQYASEIENSVEILQLNLRDFESLIRFSSNIHDQVIHNLDQLYIPVNNFYQDLNTMKLLSAGLSLDPEIYGQYGEKIGGIIMDIFNSYPNFIENQKKVKKFASNSFVAIQSLKKNYLDNACHILSFCKIIKDTLVHKEEQAAEFRPILEKILGQSKELSSNILTHLQFQDIVQQKIEHVKQIHGDIINNLTTLIDKSDQVDYELTKAKLFLQIKEIALLQSAQMVYANREYQKAIEIITKEFMKLSDCFEEINAMYKTFISPEKNVNGSSFDADLNIRREANLYNEIDAINNIFRLQTEGIIQRIMIFSNSFSLIFKNCSEFLNVINAIKVQQKNGNEQGTIISQMSEVGEQLTMTMNQIKSILNDNLALVNLLQQKYNEEYIANNFENIQKQEVKILSNAFREINYLNREVLQAFNMKMSAYSNPSDLKKSAESVRYYEHFESEITYIIDCLNEISDKMKEGDALEREADKEVINNLRKRYTMEIERRIHDLVMLKKGKGTINSLDENLHSVQNESEDIAEIF
jgi:hypothetical protein